MQREVGMPDSSLRLGKVTAKVAVPATMYAQFTIQAPAPAPAPRHESTVTGQILPTTAVWLGRVWP